MLKSEYESKLKKLETKWVEIQNISIEEMPDQEDIE